MTNEEQIEQLQQENALLREHIVLLTERLKMLKTQQKKDSHTSHSPPSLNCFVRPPKSLRKKSEKKAGEQPGHQGTALHLE